MLLSAGQHVLCPLVKLQHNERYWKIKLFSGEKKRESRYLHGHKSVNILSKPSTLRVDSWPHIPLGNECSFSEASPSYAADGNEIWFYWRIHIHSTSNQYSFMRKTTFSSMMIIFLHVCGGKYPFLCKFVVIIENGCPYFIKIKTCQPTFLSINFRIDLQLGYWEIRQFMT